MFDSAIFEVALGLLFIYLLLSLVCSALNETVAGWLAMRAKNLEQGIRNLLDDPGGSALARELYEHPLVKALGKDRGARKPSYLPARVFSTALLDMLEISSQEEGPKRFAQMREAIDRLESPELKKSLRTLLDEAEGNVLEFRAKLEGWFDDAMDRVSGWYKRKVQLVLLGLAAVLTIGLNADTLEMGAALLRDDAARAALVAGAERYAENSRQDGAAEPVSELERLSKEIQRSRMPLGWTGLPDGIGRWFSKIAGLVLTVFAVSLGAPFWFDLLNKISSLRSSGSKPAGPPVK